MYRTQVPLWLRDPAAAAELMSKTSVQSLNRSRWWPGRTFRRIPQEPPSRNSATVAVAPSLVGSRRRLPSAAGRPAADSRRTPSARPPRSDPLPSGSVRPPGRVPCPRGRASRHLAVGRCAKSATRYNCAPPRRRVDRRTPWLTGGCQLRRWSIPLPTALRDRLRSFPLQSSPTTTGVLFVFVLPAHFSGAGYCIMPKPLCFAQQTASEHWKCSRYAYNRFFEVAVSAHIATASALHCLMLENVRGIILQ